MRGTQLQIGANPQSCTPPGFVLELLPGKAVQTNPHLTACGEEGISTVPRKQELQEVIPKQKRLQLPLQDSSSEPSTQAASVQGRSTALFCWEDAEGTWERNPTYFSKRREVVHRGRNSTDGCLEAYPYMYLEHINYIFNSHSFMAYSQLLRYSSGAD